MNRTQKLLIFMILAVLAIAETWLLFPGLGGIGASLSGGADDLRSAEPITIGALVLDMVTATAITAFALLLLIIAVARSLRRPTMRQGRYLVKPSAHDTLPMADWDTELTDYDYDYVADPYYPTAYSYNQSTASPMGTTAVASSIPAAAVAPIQTIVRQPTIEVVRQPSIEVAPPKFSSVDQFSPDMSFATVVMSEKNDFAVRTSRAVAVDPGAEFNPLVLYGQPGTGKTHMLHAMGHALRVKAPTRIVSIRQLLRDFDNCNRTGQMDAFQAHYTDLRAVLLDDFQLIRSHGELEQALLGLFQDWLEAGVQIIVASDQHPDQIGDLQPQLRARLLGGLAVEIQAPGPGAARIILDNLTSANNWSVSSEVLDLIAAQPYDNVRELRGALTRVMALARFSDMAISPAQVREALNLTSVEREIPRVDTELQEGHSYLFQDESYHSSDVALREMLDAGRPALVISREAPRRMADRANINLGEIRPVWLTQSDTEAAINPNDLEVLAHTIKEFTRSHPGSLVVFNGIEYLLTYNSFSTVIKLVQQLRDHVAVHHALMLVSVSPGTMETRDMKNLEREFTPVQPGTRFVLAERSAPRQAIA